MRAAAFVSGQGSGITGTIEALRREDAEVAPTWRRFVQAAAGADCAVIAVDSLRWAEDFVPTIRTWWIHAGPARPPTVLVTAKDAEGLRRVADLDIEQVIFLDEVQDELPAAMRRARARGFFAAQANPLVHRQALSPAVREALSEALLRVPPFREVSELAAALEVSPDQLRGRWRDEGFSQVVSLNDLLKMILLARAAGRKAPGRSWDRVAEEVGVDRRTLERAAKRWLGGATLGSLARLPGSAFDVLDGALDKLLKAHRDETSRDE